MHHSANFVPTLCDIRRRGGLRSVDACPSWLVDVGGAGWSRVEQAADGTVGIPILRPRLLAFVINAFFGAVAGSLYAHFIPAFSPSVFYFDITFE